jgi:hypothetical protein
MACNAFDDLPDLNDIKNKISLVKAIKKKKNFVCVFESCSFLKVSYNIGDWSKINIVRNISRPITLLLLRNLFLGPKQKHFYKKIQIALI